MKERKKERKKEKKERKKETTSLSPPFCRNYSISGTNDKLEGAVDFML